MAVGYAFNPFTVNFDAIHVPAALTRVNDTNVTLTLGGTPASSLLAATSLTLGWTGQLGLARGGTNADLSGTGGTSQVLKQTTLGGAVTVAQLAASDLSNGTTGSGAVALATAPTFVTSIISPLVYGDSAVSGTLTLQSTSNSTRGKVIVADLMQVATTTQAFGSTNGLFIEVGSGNASVTTAALTCLKFDPTITIKGNSAITLASLFNAQYSNVDDGTARTVGPSLLFASQPTFSPTVASGLTVNDLAGIPAVVSFYHSPTFTRSGSGTGTATTSAGLYISNQAAVATGFTVTNYCGMLIDLPGTLTGTMTNFYGVKNNGAAATGRWFLYETGGMASSHKGSFRFGDNTAPTAVVDIQGTINTNQTTANGAVATAMSSVGPTGSHTTIQEWLTIKINGTTRYIPCF